jgi:hypothetical protein
MLEDDGITDIHGSITSYSQTGAAAVPEPSTLALLAGAIAVVAAANSGSRKRGKLV